MNISKYMKPENIKPFMKMANNYMNKNRNALILAALSSTVTGLVVHVRETNQKEKDITDACKKCMADNSKIFEAKITSLKNDFKEKERKLQNHVKQQEALLNEVYNECKASLEKLVDEYEREIEIFISKPNKSTEEINELKRLVNECAEYQYRQFTPGILNETYFMIGNIAELNVECIVNAANKSLLGGGGVDAAIHRAAGKELLEECKILNGCNTGDAKITKGYNLLAKSIIHTVGPIYSGKADDAEKLASCYIKSLDLAKENDIHSIAFPSISTGAYGYPVAEASKIALNTINNWVKENLDYEMMVFVCCYDENTYITYRNSYKQLG